MTKRTFFKLALSYLSPLYHRLSEFSLCVSHGMWSFIHPFIHAPNIGYRFHPAWYFGYYWAHGGISFCFWLPEVLSQRTQSLKCSNHGDFSVLWCLEWPILLHKIFCYHWFMKSVWKMSYLLECHVIWKFKMSLCL